MASLLLVSAGLVIIEGGKVSDSLLHVPHWNNVNWRLDVGIVAGVFDFRSCCSSMSG